MHPVSCLLAQSNGVHKQGPNNNSYCQKNLSRSDKVCSQGSQVGDLKCCRLADGSTEHARACGSISLRYAEKLLLLLSMRLPRTEQLVAVRLLLRPREMGHENTKWKGPGATMGRARHLIFPNRPETCSRQCVVKVSISNRPSIIACALWPAHICPGAVQLPAMPSGPQTSQLLSTPSVKKNVPTMLLCLSSTSVAPPP